MDTILNQKPYIQPLSPDWYSPHVQNVSMLRLDEVHPVVSGNKWYKLKENIKYAQSNGLDTILTFGGPYSNHLIATAYACKQAGLKSIGIVRGAWVKDNLTPTLQDCTATGMELQFVSKEIYAQKEEDNYLCSLKEDYPNAHIVPEGGANKLGVEGIAALSDYILPEYSHICVSVGTGTTMAGLLSVLSSSAKCYGYAPMKGGAYIADDIIQLSESSIEFNIFDEWHFGGFGKSNDELLQFMNIFYDINDIPLDIVYTSKMMYGIQEQIQQGYFPGSANILCIHTGGLQGNVSVAKKLKY